MEQEKAHRPRPLYKSHLGFLHPPTTDLLRPAERASSSRRNFCLLFSPVGILANTFCSSPWVRCTVPWRALGRSEARRRRWPNKTRRRSRGAGPTSGCSTTAGSSRPSSASARRGGPTPPRSRRRNVPGAMVLYSYDAALG